MIDLYGGSVEMWIENNGKMIRVENLFSKGLGYVNSVSVRIGLGEIFNIEVELDPPLEEAISILSSGKIGLGFSVGKDTTKSTGEKKNVITLNKMAVRLHYGGLSSPVFKGVMTMPQLTINDSGISIKLQAVGMLFDATATSQGGKSMSNSMTKLQVVEKLLGPSIKVKYDIKDSKLMGALNVPFEEKNITETNFEMAKKILAGANCDLVYIGSNGVDDTQKVEIISKDNQRSVGRRGPTFVAFKQINPNAGVYPILAMDSALTNLTLPGGAFGSKIKVFDKNIGVAKDDEAGQKSYDKDVSDKNTSPDGKISGGGEQVAAGESGDAALSRPDEHGGIMGMVSRAGSEGVDSIKGIVHDYMSKTFQYSIKSVGVVNLLPGRTVGVNIADISAFTGQYDLVTVTHSMSSSGVETDMELIRMGGYVSSFGSKLNDVASGAVNNVNIVKSIPLR